MKEEDKQHVSDLKNYVSKAEERVKYSLERLDILIISLSSGGLVLGLNLFKNFQNTCINKSSLKTSWLFFSLALIINLLSQVTGYLANKYDIKVTKNEIRELENKELEGNNEWIERYQIFSDFFTKWFNILSFISLVIGITSLIFFINFRT